MTDPYVLRKLLDEMKESIHAFSGEMDTTGEREADVVEELNTFLSALYDAIVILEEKLLPLANSFAQYKLEYSRYRKEYERLIGSGSIQLALKLRDILGRDYAPLVPSQLEMAPEVLLADDSVSSLSRDKLVQNKEKVQWFEKNWKPLVQNIAASNGSGYFKKAPIRAGIITDEYMFNYYKDALNFEYIDADSYKSQIDNEGLQFILYVSCWTGMHGNDYPGDSGREKVVEVFEYANSKGIPTVFHTIEDPPHFDKFLGIAKAAKYIFTSDSSMIGAYIDATANNNVWALEYGVNPFFHNPIGLLSGKASNRVLSPDVVFSGSWYADFPIRCIDCERIFDGVLESPGHDLVVIDRHSEEKLEAKRLNVFPPKYESALASAISHGQLQRVHKLFNYSVCLNSIKDSKTMCAMRAYELQALGTLLLSNFCISVIRHFPTVFCISNSDEVGFILDGYNDREVLNLQIKGIREVLSKCTVFDRLNYVFQKIGVNYSFPVRRIGVVVPCELMHAFEDLRQRSSIDFQLIERDGVEICQSRDRCDYLVFSDDLFGGYDFFLDDAINAFKYVDVDFVMYSQEKDSHIAFEYCNGAPSLNNILLSVDRVDLSRLHDAEYLASLQGFVLPEEKWHRSTGSSCKDVAVVIPFFDAGDGLERLMLSMLRSSVFNKLSIYFVACGECTSCTDETLERFCRDFDNVFLIPNGSGGKLSCAQACNVGLHSSCEPYIVFASPAGEFINDGLSRILGEAIASEADVVVSNHIVNEPPFYEPFVVSPLGGSGAHCGGCALLIENDFARASVQSCMYDRHFLESSSIAWHLDSAKPDALFYYESICESNRVSYLDFPSTVQYAEDGSCSACPAQDLFDTFLDHETILVSFLREKGLLVDYIDKRLKADLDAYRKVAESSCSIADLAYCMSIIGDIEAIYKEAASWEARMENVADAMKGAR